MKLKNLSNKVKVIKQNKIDFLVRTILTLFIVLVFLVLYFCCGGKEYFAKTNIVTSCNDSDLEVHFIDVGQGDATLIRFPNDKTMLIDTGESYESDNLIFYLKNFLSFNNISTIDYLVLTHQDADHVGGTSEVLNNFNVGIVYRPKCFSISEKEMYPNLSYKVVETKIYEDAISSIYQNNVDMVFNESGIEFFEGDASIVFLSPSQDNYSNSNNYSAVIKIECKGKTFLFTGDSEQEIEEELMNKIYQDLDIDVLKVSHHGSKTATSEEFLVATTPIYACISVGEDNSYNLPNQEVLDLLKKANCEILMTKDCGSFAIAVSNGNLGVYFINLPQVDFTIVIAVCGLCIILIWGIKIKKRKS